MMADRLRRRGIKTEWVLASTLTLSMAAQAALVFRWPVPSFLVWAVIAAAGATTVLSFAILTQYFPKEMSGRANAALNLLHVGGAFLLQSATGLIIEQWPEAGGTYPAEAHQLAMAAALVLQLVALAWFASPPRRVPAPVMGRSTSLIPPRHQLLAGDSDYALREISAGVDAACGGRPQASRGLAVRRGRIGDALRWSHGFSFHDD